MRVGFLKLVVVLLLSSLSSSYAEYGDSIGPKSDSVVKKLNLIQQHINRLSSDEDKVREKAYEALLKSNTFFTQQLLELALSETKDADLKITLKQLIERHTIKTHANANTALGLVFYSRIDKKQLRVGKPIVVTTTIYNVDNDVVELEANQSDGQCHIYFGHLEVFQKAKWVPAAGIVSVMQPMPPKFVSIPANGKVSFKHELKLVKNKDVYVLQARIGGVYCTYEVTELKKLELRFEIQFMANNKAVIARQKLVNQKPNLNAKAKTNTLVISIDH